jgi:hypothetical protein
MNKRTKPSPQPLAKAAGSRTRTRAETGPGIPVAQAPARAGMSVDIDPGETKLVLERRGTEPAGQSLCVYGLQEESSDDGGSQSPIGIIEFGPSTNRVHVEFDIRDGVVLNVPATAFSLWVQNRNDVDQPVLHVSAFLVTGQSSRRNTRSFDIDPQNPNMRVPALADSVMYELTTPDDGYRALVSDSATGDDFGEIASGVDYRLHHRARWIRFFDVPPSGGIVIFTLSI